MRTFTSSTDENEKFVAKDSFADLQGDAASGAERLLGCILEREIDGHKLRARIVETEAYDQTDAASHSSHGRTPRTDIMFGPAGHLYVYFSYGMHYCCNVVVGEDGYGAAALIRAVEPLEGLDDMVVNRHGKSGVEVTNGPAKTCQALQINKLFNGHDLTKNPLKLIMQPAENSRDVVRTTRIGISKAKDMVWRFYLKGNQFVSKP